jgi:hypothetical protein
MGVISTPLAAAVLAVSGEYSNLTNREYMHNLRMSEEFTNGWQDGVEEDEHEGFECIRETGGTFEVNKEVAGPANLVRDAKAGGLNWGATAIDAQGTPIDLAAGSTDASVSYLLGYVAGVLASLFEWATPEHTPAQIKDAMYLAEKFPLYNADGSIRTA